MLNDFVYMGTMMFYKWHGETDSEIDRRRLYDANLFEIKKLKESFINEMKLIINDDKVNYFDEIFKKAMYDLGCYMVLEKIKKNNAMKQA